MPPPRGEGMHGSRVSLPKPRTSLEPKPSTLTTRRSFRDAGRGSKGPLGHERRRCSALCVDLVTGLGLERVAISSCRSRGGLGCGAIARSVHRAIERWSENDHDTAPHRVGGASRISEV